MPFQRKIDSNTGATIAIWSLTESESELVSLMKDEGLEYLKESIAHIKVKLKRRQWLASRLLLKSLIPTFGEITYDQFGAPYVVDHDVNISLSHSNGHVAAILHQDHLVGIDVQVENAKLKRIAPKFLNEIEMERYEENDQSLPYLHLLWSAKEAVFKIHRHHMAFKKIRTAKFDMLEKGMIKVEADRFDGKHKHKVHFKKMDDVYLAFSCYDPN